MRTADETVRFGAELTFEPATDDARRRVRERESALRTATALTIVVTDAHQRTLADLFCLLDRVLYDRRDSFESLHIDYVRAHTSPETVRRTDAHLAADRTVAVTSGVVDSYYEYEPARSLVTPDRYLGAPLPDGKSPAETIPDASSGS